MAKTLYDYCIERGERTLLDQWHEQKNGELTPRDVARGSHRKVWWKCEKGHEWLAEVKERAGGKGCPVCRNRKVARGENDLATTHPDLAAQWHPTKNGALTPQEILAGAKRKVWWVCEKGHEWESTVANRTVNGSGCPVCRGNVAETGVNDLETLFPQIAAQWHPTKNGDKTPGSTSPYSNYAAWWVCENGHAYRAVVASRTKRNTGCGYCAGKAVLAGFNDLATVQPKIAEQWHPTLNGDLTPEMVTCGSRKKVWWQCSEGHAWQARVFSRAASQRCGCPMCAGTEKKAKQLRYEEIIAARKDPINPNNQGKNLGEIKRKKDEQ